MKRTSGELPNPSDYLVSTYPFIRKVATLLGYIWLLALVLATYVHMDGLPSPWLEHSTLGLMAVLLVGGLGLMLACAVLVINGRKSINDRVGLFLLWILVFKPREWW